MRLRLRNTKTAQNVPEVFNSIFPIPAVHSYIKKYILEVISFFMRNLLPALIYSSLHHAMEICA